MSSVEDFMKNKRKNWIKFMLKKYKPLFKTTIINIV
jgi:hypothetical protein